MRTLFSNLFGAAVVFAWAYGGSVPHTPEPPMASVTDGPLRTTVLAVSRQDPPTPQPPAPPSKQSEHRVTGKVVDRDGKPVERAEVTFEGPKKGNVWTDALGQFLFAGPAGDYTITVKAGERQQDFQVTIEDNQLKPSTLVIEPDLLA